MHYATCEESDLVLCDGGAVVMRSREFFPRRRFLGTGMCDGIFAESGSAITCAEVTMTIGIQPETTLYRYSTARLVSTRGQCALRKDSGTSSSVACSAWRTASNFVSRAR